MGFLDPFSCQKQPSKKKLLLLPPTFLRIMLFNSLQFAAFFAIVYSPYLVLNHRW
jgi:hypothetical protein